MEKKSYQPINCSFYDELEALATLKKQAHIIFFKDGESKDTVEGVIVDFFIQDKAEYLLLESGQSIRLDYLVTVNGKELPKHC